VVCAPFDGLFDAKTVEVKAKSADGVVRTHACARAATHARASPHGSPVIA
jgi:hypothetical protein